MKHWAAPLIGKPYVAGASGPDAFDCIGLVRYYFKHCHQIELPDYRLADPAGLAAFIKATGWRPAESAATDNDVLTMENLVGKHVGVMVRNSEGLGMLHAMGSEGRGQVVWQPVDTLFGYKNIQVWRNACFN